jgi:methionyl-tRNA formyltransferase
MSLRVVFMGTPAFAVPALESLLCGDDRLIGVVTQKDRPVGRGLKPQASPVKERARQAGVPVLEPENLRDPAFLEGLRDLSPELIVVVAFGQILPEVVLGLPPLGCINVHASLLPRYRGAAPIQWAILNGESLTGVTVIQMNERMDAGDILLARETAIGPEEDALGLSRRLSRLGAEVLTEAIRGLKKGTLHRTPQREPEATYAPRLRKEDGKIDWGRGADEIARKVRALVQWPVAYTRWKRRLLKIHRARPIPAGGWGRPGEVVKADRGGLWVQTGEGCLEILELQQESRPKMDARAFLHGQGEVLGLVLGE